MKIQSIYKKAALKGYGRDRYIQENFIPLNFIFKKITPLIAILLAKLKVSPNIVSLISYLFILLGAYYALNLNFINASYSWLFFLFLDSLDGDLARVQNKENKYGQIIDSFGADIFYFLFPISISFNLIYSDNFQNYLNLESFYLIGIFCAFFHTMHRLLNIKIINLENIKHQNKIKKIKRKNNIFKRFLFLINNQYFKGNFFSEPGMIFIFSILSITQKIQYIEIYMYILMIYFFIRFLLSITKLFILGEK